MNVLIVDDSDVIAHLLVTLLAEAGHRCTELVRGAKRLLDPHDPLWTDLDVLVTDLRMPDVNGKELLEVASKHYPDVHCMVLTGYFPDTVAESDLKGMDVRVLYKPEDVLDVVRIVNLLGGLGD